MARGDGWLWIGQKVPKLMLALGQMVRVLEGSGELQEGSYRVRSAVSQKTLHIPTRHQLQQNEARGSLEAEPHTANNVLMAELAGWERCTYPIISGEMSML